MRKTTNEGFFNAYLRYIGKHESPKAFHRWIALSLVSAMLGRRTWLDRRYKLYPNQYIILAGPSSKGRRSTAMEFGVKLLRSCDVRPHMLEEDATPSALRGLLHQVENTPVLDDGTVYGSAALYVIASELTTFMGSQPMNEEMIKLLTKLYDAPEVYGYITRKHKRETINKVCVNMLGSSNINYLRQAIPHTSVAGGIVCRCLFVHADAEIVPVYEPKKPENEGPLFDALRADLEAVGTLAGEFRMSKEAYAYLEGWYVKEGLRYSDNDPLDLFFSRKPDHIHKVAMALSAAEGDELVIELRHAQEAKELVEALEPGMREVVGSVELGPEYEVIRRILDVIYKHKRISHVKLQRSVGKFAKRDVLKDALEMLIDAGLVRRLMEPGQRPGRESQWYEALPGAEKGL